VFNLINKLLPKTWLVISVDTEQKVKKEPWWWSLVISQNMSAGD
jgi:hypothetical protein